MRASNAALAVLAVLTACAPRLYGPVHSVRWGRHWHYEKDSVALWNCEDLARAGLGTVPEAQTAIDHCLTAATVARVSWVAVGAGAVGVVGVIASGSNVLDHDWVLPTWLAINATLWASNLYRDHEFLSAIRAYNAGATSEPAR
jgi:hypothetical protein